MKTNIFLFLIVLLMVSGCEYKSPTDRCSEIIEEYRVMKHDHYYLGRGNYLNAMNRVLLKHDIILSKEILEEIELDYQKNAKHHGYKPYGNK